jgi:hypothetical protein
VNALDNFDRTPFEDAVQSQVQRAACEQPAALRACCKGGGRRCGPTWWQLRAAVGVHVGLQLEGKGKCLPPPGTAARPAGRPRTRPAPTNGTRLRGTPFLLASTRTSAIFSSASTARWTRRAPSACCARWVGGRAGGLVGGWVGG